MKISVIIPVKNEAATVAALLDSLLSQTRLPDEIVITDGGSTDQTVSIISEYQKKHDRITLIREKHALPGRGRNIAIASAHGDVIAMTDAGITRSERWLESLVEPFEQNNECEVVYGLCGVNPQTLFEHCYVIVAIPEGEADNGLSYPTLASVALKRHVWQRAGCFREDLRAAEDLIFFKQLKELKCKATIAPGAVIYWRPRTSLEETFRLNFAYSACDARTWFHVDRHIRNILVYGGFIFLAAAGTTCHSLRMALPFLIIAYWLSRCFKQRHRLRSLLGKKPYAVAIIIAIAVVIDLGSMAGFLAGLSKRNMSGHV